MHCKKCGSCGLLVPGGNISSIDNEEVHAFIRAVVADKHLVAGTICFMILIRIV